MMKRSIKYLVVVLFTLSIFAGSVFAQDFASFYTVGSSGSTTQQTVFGYGDIPWLYVELDSTGATAINTTWTAPSSAVDNANITIDDGLVEYWITLIDWSSVKEVGDWDIDGLIAPGGATASTSFTVVPEPVSSTLFVIGSATLGFRRFKKRKFA